MNQQWINYYQEFANKLLQYKDNRASLIEIINQVFSNTGINMPKMEEDGILIDIDPFTVFGIFNKGIKNENRILLMKEFSKLMGMTSNVENDFDGIPVLNNQAATFYYFGVGRGNDDIQNLWNVFSYGLEYADTLSEDSRRKFIEYYDKCLLQKGVKWNITMGLYWARPLSFLNLDSRNRWFICDDSYSIASKELIDAVFEFDKKDKVPSGEEYLKICEICKKELENMGVTSFTDFSYQAWKISDDVNEEIKNNTKKQSSAAFLKWFQPVLNALRKLNGAATPAQVREQITKDEKLSKEELEETRGKNKVNKFENEVAFARSYLVRAGYIKNETRGIWELTEKGMKEDVSLEKASEIFTQQVKQSVENRKDSSVDKDIVIKKYWLYAPGENSCMWEEFYNAGIMAIGWDALGDLSQYSSKAEIKQKMQEVYHSTKSFRNDVLATWQFCNEVQVGDVIFVKKGTQKVIGRGIVESEYIYDSSANSEYCNIRKVKWIDNFEADHPGKAVLKTLTEITQYTEYVNQLNDIYNVEKDLMDDEEEENYPTYSKEDFLEEVYMLEEDYETLSALVRKKKNVILQGAPGVGKTFAAKRLAYSMMGVKDVSRVQMVQFHQSYSYEDFVEGYRPNEKGFALEKGAFYDFCKLAEDDSENDYYFIIDEINRGNLSKIFGELFMLIENDKRGRKHEIQLLYSKEKFHVPQNVYIIGMMNTADRSLAMLDYALRRRFAFFDILPGFESDGFRMYQEGLQNENFDKLIRTVITLNDTIRRDDSLGEGFCIGHSYFCNYETMDNKDISEIIEYEIIPLLKEYWFDEPVKMAGEIENLRRVTK